MGSPKNQKSKTTEHNLKKNRWVAMKTQEYGWIAGWIENITKDMITVRVAKRIAPAKPATFKSFDGWVDCEQSILTYFKEAHNCPRIVPMPFLKSK